jgi:glycosyltransferase involved in cell wall biosynthesis
VPSQDRSKRISVAMVAPSLRILGGQAVQADRLLKAWANDPDVDAWLVPVNPVPPGLLRHATRIKYVRTVATQLTYGPSLPRRLKSADVVHVFSAAYTSFLLAPLPAVLAAKALGKPVVLNYRSGEAADHLARSAVARRTLRSVERNVVPSAFLAGVFDRYGIGSSIIPNLVDLTRFGYRVREILQPRLVSTRNLEGLYNVACTLRAFRRVQHRWPAATLTLVGAGPEEAALKSLATSLGLQGVTFAGRMAPDQMAPVYARHDIYLQSPNIDNMPTSVLEAFASGLPVVSTNAGGIPAILEHGRHGLLGELNDDEALAGHVLRLLDEPMLAHRLAEAAYLTCARCSWTAVRPQWLDVYRDLAPKPSLTFEASAPRRPVSW